MQTCIHALKYRYKLAHYEQSSVRADIKFFVLLDYLGDFNIQISATVLAGGFELMFSSKIFLVRLSFKIHFQFYTRRCTNNSKEADDKKLPLEF